MVPPKSYHMTPEEFRRHGHQVIDWIADYYQHIESFPVLSQAKPGQIRASLPPAALLHAAPRSILIALPCRTPPSRPPRSSPKGT